jgi:hypothetical protein
MGWGTVAEARVTLENDSPSKDYAVFASCVSSTCSVYRWSWSLGAYHRCVLAFQRGKMKKLHFRMFNITSISIQTRVMYCPYLELDTTVSNSWHSYILEMVATTQTRSNVCRLHQYPTNKLFANVLFSQHIPWRSYYDLVPRPLRAIAELTIIPWLLVSLVS